MHGVIGLFATFHVGKEGRYIFCYSCKAYAHSRGTLLFTLFLLFSSCLQPDNAYVCTEEEETGRGDKERLNLLTGLLCLALTCIGAVEKVYIHVFSLVPKPRLF